MELARLIGQSDPFAPVPGSANDSRKPDERAADVARGPSEFARRDSQAAPPRVPLQPARPGADHFEPPRAPESFDFLQPSSRDEYPVAPRQALAGDSDFHDDHNEEPSAMRQHSAHGRQDEHHEYAHEPNEYRDDEYEHDDDYGYDAEPEHSDDDAPGSKRRNTTKVVIAVLGLAVFGSAAAFGYRTIFKTAPSGPTPIIRADSSPTKMSPTDANPKPISERLDDRAGERLVRRDEDPVDIGVSYRSGAGATGAVGSSGPFSDTSGSLPPATVPASTGGGGPGNTKSVRTVTIPADQGVAPSERTALPSASPRPAVPQRQAAVTPAPSLPPAPSPALSPAPIIAPEAGGPRTTEAGGFVVQLSAQRSEAEAQASFRTLQAKYSMLGGHQLLIRRKDQGDRGVFYAAQVGPFGAKSDADQLCETLKSAGGSCFVQRN